VGKEWLNKEKMRRIMSIMKEKEIKRKKQRKAET
jgi:hypothetical protein